MAQDDDCAQRKADNARTATQESAMIRVLLVDDDQELTAMLSEYLEREGFETSAVHTGEEGEIEALSGLYSIVVLDVMLPRLSGIEVLRRIRARSQVPVVLLTARGDNIDRITGLELGADDYVPKPSSPGELVARLRAIMRRVQPGDRHTCVILDDGSVTCWGLGNWGELGASGTDLAKPVQAKGVSNAVSLEASEFMTTMGDMALTAQAPALILASPSDALARVSTTKMNRPTPAMLGTSVRTMASSDIKARFISKPLSV